MKKILIICYSHHDKEPRLLMQCSALKNRYRITTAGLTPTGDPEISFIPLKGEKGQALFNFHLGLPKILRLPFTAVNKLQMKITGANAFFSAQDFEVLRKEKQDLIICHHPSTLELGFRLKKEFQCRLIFNAHEIYPLEFEEDHEWMKKNSAVIDTVLKKYLPLCDQIFSVNKEICDFYRSRYSCKCLPVHNSKPYADLNPASVSTPIRIIHHGGAMPQRKLEQMAEAVLANGNKFELSFMLVNTNSAYLKSLKEKYEPKGIRFPDAVPFSKIIETINHFDIGLYILPADNINQQLALPNKLFEFIQARLAVITSPNKAIKNIVLSHGVGAVSEDFETASMTRLLNSITTKQVQAWKEKCNEAAKHLSSDKDEQNIFETVQHILN